MGPLRAVGGVAHPAGGLHPALAPVVLDEIAWWLGALAMREGGLTNRIVGDSSSRGARGRG